MLRHKTPRVNEPCPAIKPSAYCPPPNWKPGCWSVGFQDFLRLRLLYCWKPISEWKNLRSSPSPDCQCSGLSVYTIITDFSSLGNLASVSIKIAIDLRSARRVGRIFLKHRARWSIKSHSFEIGIQCLIKIIVGWTVLCKNWRFMKNESWGCQKTLSKVQPAFCKFGQPESFEEGVLKPSGILLAMLILCALVLSTRQLS